MTGLYRTPMRPVVVMPRSQPPMPPSLQTPRWARPRRDSLGATGLYRPASQRQSFVSFQTPVHDRATVSFQLPPDSSPRLDSLSRPGTSPRARAEGVGTHKYQGYEVMSPVRVAESTPAASVRTALTSSSTGATAAAAAAVAAASTYNTPVRAKPTLDCLQGGGCEVWFHSPQNSAHPITPYAEIYGVHPRFFHFDSNGHMVPSWLEGQSPKNRPCVDTSPETQARVDQILGDASTDTREEVAIAVRSAWESTGCSNTEDACGSSGTQSTAASDSESRTSSTHIPRATLHLAAAQKPEAVPRTPKRADMANVSCARGSQGPAARQLFACTSPALLECSSPAGRPAQVPRVMPRTPSARATNSLAASARGAAASAGGSIPLPLQSGSRNQVSYATGIKY